MLDARRLQSEEEVANLLAQEHALPGDPIHEHIVLWKTFRDRDAALRFSQAIRLGEGQHVVGGTTRDSIGSIYWLGVHVDNLEQWGNTRAIQLTDAFDAESPTVHGRPFE